MDKHLTRYLTAVRSTLLLIVVLGLLATATVVVQMAFLSEIVSQVFLSHTWLAALWPSLLLLLIVAIARAALTGGRELLARRAAIRVKHMLRTQLFAHLLRLGPTYSRDERTGELIMTAVEGIERLDTYISRYLPQVFLSVLVPLSIAVAIAPLDATSAVLLLLTAPIIPLLMVLVGKHAEERIQRQWDGLARMGAHFLDVVQGLPTLLLFGRAEAESARIARISERFRERTMQALRIAFLSGMVLEFMVACAIGVIAVTLGVRLLNGDISFQRAFLVLLLAPEFYRPIRDLGTHRHAGMEGKAAMARIAEILDTPLPVAPPDYPANTAVPHAPEGRLTLALRGVTYTYPGSDHPALDGVSLMLRPGTCTALVGRSGAGKSTLVNVLLRFLDTQGGTITANGLPLDSLPPEVWRTSVALVPQRPYLFAGTVRENLRLARPTASDAEITQAATLAGADDFIHALPQGYETPIEERGARLSAGQIQRVAIARAFLKDAPLLILDEPTSHLDPESEALIRHALQTLMRGRTVLVVAHRLNTIKAAEQIAVLEHGHVIEAGAPAELLQAGGAYARLVGGAKSTMATPLAKATTDGAVRQAEVLAMTDMTDTTGMKSMRIFLRLVRPLTALHWRIGLAVLLGVLMVASNIGLLGMAAYLIAASALKPLLVLLTLPIYVVQLAGIARAATRYAERLTGHNLTFRLLARLRTQVYHRLARLAPGQLGAYRSGDLLARLVADVDEIQHVYLRMVGPFLVAGLIALLTSGLFALFSPLLAWTALAFLVVAGVGLPLLAGRLSRGLGERQLTARGELNAQLVDGIQGVQDVLAFGQEREFQGRIARLDDMLARVQRHMATIGALEAGLEDLVTSLAVWAILLLAIPLISAHHIGGIYLAFLALVMLASFEAVQPLGSGLQFLGHALAAGRRLFAVLDSTSQVTDPAEPLLLPSTPSTASAQLDIGKADTKRDAEHKPRYTLTFDHVSFAYRSEDGPALADVSFTVPAGSRIAIVGPSGAGKSTLARLAVRFADPSGGTICLNGTDIRSYTLRDVRATIGVVTQETYIFNDTLRRNLLLASPDATDTEMEQVLEQAQLGDFLRQLPRGLDTWVGEQGQRLAGGERQRLAIARTLLRNTPLLILDEPTANLDPITEQELLGALETAVRGHTTLHITHRLCEMERMDAILVLDHGQIIERGTHTHLLALDGLYRRLFDVQRGMLALVPDQTEALYG